MASKFPLFDLHFPYRRSETMPFIATHAPAKPAAIPVSGRKSLFYRHHRQSPVLLTSSSTHNLDPSSICLDKLVRSFIEQNPDNRRSYSSFHDDSGSSALLKVSRIAKDSILQGLAACASDGERDLLAAVLDVLNRVKGRGDCRRRTVVEWLREIGYDAAVCTSRWENTASVPAGEHEYIVAVMGGGERVVVDLDFRSEFEIARPAKGYQEVVLQALPVVFVGKEERLQSLLVVVCEAAKRSFVKKGLHLPPWRKVEYMREKWMSPCERGDTGKVLGGETSERSSAAAAVWQWPPPVVRMKVDERTGYVGAGLASLFRDDA